MLDTPSMWQPVSQPEEEKSKKVADKYPVKKQQTVEIYNTNSMKSDIFNIAPAAEDPKKILMMSTKVGDNKDIIGQGQENLERSNSDSESIDLNIDKC